MIASQYGIVSDWGRVDINNQAHRVQLSQALTEWMNPYRRFPILKSRAQAFARTGDLEIITRPIRAFATKDDFPASVAEVLDKYHQTTFFDVGYEEIFNIRDYRNVPRSSFEILDVESGLAFNKVQVGEKAELYKMSGSKVTVSIDQYAGGLQWSRLLFDDREYWTLEDSALAYRNAFYSGKAQAFYDLLDAVSADYDLTWQAGVDGIASGTENYTVQRDVATLNTAAVNIITRCASLGFGVGPSSTLIILAPLQLKERITNALTHTFQAKTGSPVKVQYAFMPIFTTMLSETDKYYVILPKNKLVGANRQDLTILFDMDVMSNSELAVGWARYAGAVGEEKQIVRCSTS